MQPYPHRYAADAEATATGTVAVGAAGLPTLETASPPEFDGPPGHWSPEALLVAAVADCYVLSFRAVARAVGFEWRSMTCRVEGVLERVSGVTRFTRFTTSARLRAPRGVDRERARQVLERAEKVCLIANSLSAERLLEIEVLAEES
jgi:organic hydroperoxide reductase OsmC/OhrA